MKRYNGFTVFQAFLYHEGKLSVSVSSLGETMERTAKSTEPGGWVPSAYIKQRMYQNAPRRRR